MSFTSAHGASWPALQYEDVAWDVHPVSGMPRGDRSMIGRSYRASIVAPIAGVDVQLSAQTQSLAEEAAVALARFDQEVGQLVAPYAAVVMRSESASSSQIENLSASARRIAEAEALGRHASQGGSGSSSGPGAASNAELIVANTAAMRTALGHRSTSVSAQSILDIHQALLGEVDPSIAGRWRADQVWIGGATPHSAQFVPPVAERVPAAIADLTSFIARQDLPALAQTAIAHAQFETIHPFPDGNGRTGRALMYAILREKEVLTEAAAPISSGLLQNTDDYFEALTLYRQGQLEPIVSKVARAALMGVDNGRALVADLTRVRATWDETGLRDLRSHSKARVLADGLLQHPVITASTAATILGSDANVHRHIHELVRRGVLISHQDYKSRNMTWRAQDVLDALDDYVARSGRRA